MKILEPQQNKRRREWKKTFIGTVLLSMTHAHTATSSSAPKTWFRRRMRNGRIRISCSTSIIISSTFTITQPIIRSTFASAIVMMVSVNRASHFAVHASFPCVVWVRWGARAPSFIPNFHSIRSTFELISNATNMNLIEYDYFIDIIGPYKFNCHKNATGNVEWNWLGKHWHYEHYKSYAYSANSIVSINENCTHK